MDFDLLHISSPKRTPRQREGWQGFFPYYAGYPSEFAESLLASAKLSPDQVVLDPWNGSGTTTFAASRLGLKAVGVDLNPVMALVAKARMLRHTEADSLEPIARDLVKRAVETPAEIDDCDPLYQWFGPATSAALRSIEFHCRTLLLGERTITSSGTDFTHFSSLASTFYVALYSVALGLASRFRTSNPTWTRKPRADEKRAYISGNHLRARFVERIGEMAVALESTASLFDQDPVSPELLVGDTCSLALEPDSIDVILTSPPYCTRIDYTAATAIQLAVTAPLLSTQAPALSSQMIGSVNAPMAVPPVNARWGATCARLLQQVRDHPSKASKGYYYRTHVDYFDKLDRSLSGLSRALKTGGTAFFVVQDSYYKDVHNDLPKIVEEMVEGNGLELRRKEAFPISRTIAASHRYAKKYVRPVGATEAVLCFAK